LRCARYLCAGLSYKNGFCVRHEKKEVFSLVSHAPKKTIEISSFSFYKKTLYLCVFQ
jgi:hypothetical protein